MCLCLSRLLDVEMAQETVCDMQACVCVCVCVRVVMGVAHYAVRFMVDISVNVLCMLTHVLR